MLKKIVLVALITLGVFVGADAQGALRKVSEKPSKAYGIRSYSEVAGYNALVSFSVNNPSVITEEFALNDMYIRAAACDGTTYYMIQSDDQMVAYSFWTMDLATHELKKVVEYTKHDAENAMLFVDMTYDFTENMLYAWVFDIAAGEAGEEGGFDIPFELVKIDPATGRADVIGENTYVQFLTIAADAYGSLYSIDLEGRIWWVSKWDGMPAEPYGYSNVSGAGLQSMCYDQSDNTFYWSGFKTDGESYANGFFSKFAEDEYGELIYSDIGNFPNSEEIIGLYIDSNPSAPNAPKPVSYLTLTPAGDGENSAVIEWVNPNQLNNGNPIEDVVKAHVYREGELVGTLEECWPDESSHFTDYDVPSGLYRYSVVAEVAGVQGDAAYTDAKFVGADVPGKVENIVAAKASDSNDITISWTAPSKGMHGGWWNSATATYKVTRVNDGSVVAESTTEASVVDNNITQLAGYQYAITAISADGVGDTAKSENVISGPAMTPPYFCDFSTDEQRNLWKVFDADHDGQTWYYENHFGGTDDWFFKYLPSFEINPEKAANDWFISAPIHLEKGKHYIYSYTVRLYGSMFPCNYTMAFGTEPNPEAMTNVLCKRDAEVIDDFEMVDNNIAFEVEETGDYYFGGQVRNLIPAHFTNIGVKTVLDTDMVALSLSGSQLASEGTESHYILQVLNAGYYEVNNYTIQLIDDEENVLAETESGPLAPQEKAEVVVVWTPAKKGACNLRARVIVQGEMKDDDNTTQPIKVEVIEKGSWADITDGTLENSVSPFYLYKLHSSEEIIYTKDEINVEKGKIRGIKLYYSDYANRPVSDFNAQIYLANTDKETFCDEEGVWELDPDDAVLPDDMTKVFDGTISIDPYGTELPIIFDNTFDYSGANVVALFVQQGTETSSSMRWIERYDKTLGMRCCYHSGTEAYDWSTPLNLSWDVPNISFFFPDESAGVNEVAQDGTDISVAVEGETVVVNGILAKGFITDLSGRIVKRISGERTNISGLAQGVYIIVAQSKSGAKVTTRFVKLQ